MVQKTMTWIRERYVHTYYCHAPANPIHNCQLKRKSSRVKIGKNNFKDVETTISTYCRDIAL